MAVAANGAQSPDRGVDALVISGAARPDTLAFARRRHPDALVIAADGGLAAAVAIGLPVDMVVGDLDSVDAQQLADAEAHGALVETHPREKDATDLELAVRKAMARRATSVVVVDSTAGRLDHFLGGVILLASGLLVGLEVTAYIDDAMVVVVRGGGTRAVPAPIGALVTLLPTHGAAVGVTTEGLQYPLTRETLVAGTTRGVSNVVIGPDPRVSVTAGALLVIVPDAITRDEGADR
ncbi:MAG TPA: thiamine diphosphokinase [Acidimicrobiia bacterium]